MYQELIAELSQGNSFVHPQPPCPAHEMNRAEKAVGYPFPKELRDLLRELNGDHWLLLSADEIIKNVESNRAYYLPFFEMDLSREVYTERVDRFIFFATNGCGDYYGYRVAPDGVPDETAIYIWEHEEIGETCCWRKVAANMTEFITRYYQNEI